MHFCAGYVLKVPIACLRKSVLLQGLLFNGTCASLWPQTNTWWYDVYVIYI